MVAPWTRRTPLICERATDTLPASTDEALFRITGGKIKVHGIYGEVTTVIQTQACATKLKFNPSGTGSDVDLCATLDITADAVGTIYSITGVVATAMKSTTLWVVLPADDIGASGLTLSPGDIELDCAATNTGSVKWTLVYSIIDSAAEVNAV
jgi:hypothetical protein